MLERRIDLLSPDLYGDVARRTYASMRHDGGVVRDDNGLWGIASHDALLTAARNPETFSNAGGSRPDTGPLPWMIDMDASDHLKRRKLVSRGFTPARVRDSEPRLRRLCDDLIDRVCARGSCDVVRDLAAPLPMIVIGDMLGVAPEDRDQLLRWSDDLLGSLGGSPERMAAAAAAFVEYTEYARHTIAARRSEPTDDLVSVLVHAEVDGDHLDDSEIIMESLLILVGGDETTRHVITGGLEQLLRNGDARQALTNDRSLLASAVEEMLRWVSPIKNMNRTVTRDVELSGAELRAGDKALLLYESANFDESHFDEPERFDISRSPNDHLAFGFGPHVCLGASLARMEITVMIDRVLARLPDFELATDDELPRFLGGITDMPVRFTPT